MDSMRSLNTSLPPTSSSRPQTNEPPEQLLQAFKTAALSVTKLYKTAAADQSRARSEGYQDALDDLLAFLDKESIGLNDGEGWRIRRWATERLDGRDSISPNQESDDEVMEKTDRGSSPALQRSQSTAQPLSAAAPAGSASPVRAESIAPTTITTATASIFTDHSPSTTPPQGTFTFRSSHPYPQDADITLSDLNLSDSRAQGPDSTITAHTSLGQPGITIARPGRTNSRHNNRTNSRPTAPLNRTERTGQKRKINLGEFFDLGNLGHGKDGFGGGGKRGKYA
ncbi:hypothetical protein F5884DRAFT_72922 [Xylogone sp. PMI_703]|nr:hypothetical protein F5884DRAFT_72922 [Xylogone sp. PMI_703]